MGEIWFLRSDVFRLARRLNRDVVLIVIRRTVKGSVEETITGNTSRAR